MSSSALSIKLTRNFVDSEEEEPLLNKVPREFVEGGDQKRTGRQFQLPS